MGRIKWVQIGDVPFVAADELVADVAQTVEVEVKVPGRVVLVWQGWSWQVSVW